MGLDKHYPEEAPAHLITIGAFWIDPTPVTNKQFRKFVNETGRHCVMTKAISHIALVLTLAVMSIGAARADDVPDLNVDPVCRGIAQQASGPAERGGPDLAFSQCVKSEQAMRQKLMGEWSTFAPADRANCVGSERGALASYTDLVTCLEMARDARQLNK